jgi:hypothetical protein
MKKVDEVKATPEYVGGGTILSGFCGFDDERD